MANIHERLIGQNELNYQTVFSSRIDKHDEEDQILDEIRFLQ